jgi:thioredoxin reductase (NADPH)
VAVAPRFVARAELFEQLGGVPTEHPNGTFIAADPTGRTAVPGVWAAGNASNLAAMVVAAMGAGVMTAAAVNADLVAEDADAAVRARRLVPPAGADAA